VISGYYAFIPYRRRCATSPEGGSNFCFIVFASVAKQSPGREAKKYVILNAVKNPTEELTGHILFTLVVGYFANAQYDVLFIPHRHFVPLPPKEESNYCHFER
ncbi:MAG: hypothetical protein SO003_07590, partial [Candidatus Borkfalkiaceae bacterium]|nr:hypothetical protein [Christensenellaceae bacterium]